MKWIGGLLVRACGWRRNRKGRWWCGRRILLQVLEEWVLSLALGCVRRGDTRGRRGRRSWSNDNWRRRWWRCWRIKVLSLCRRSRSLWRSLLWSFVIGRAVLVVNGLKLALKLSLALLRGLNLGTLSGKSCFLLLCFGLCRLLATLFLFFLDLTRLHLLFKSLQTCLCCLTFLCQLALLALSIVPNIMSV